MASSALADECSPLSRVTVLPAESLEPDRAVRLKIHDGVPAVVSSRAFDHCDQSAVLVTVSLKYGRGLATCPGVRKPHASSAAGAMPVKVETPVPKEFVFSSSASIRRYELPAGVPAGTSEVIRQLLDFWLQNL